METEHRSNEGTKEGSVEPEHPKRDDGLLLFDVKTRSSSEINTFDYQGWKEVEVTIDSGACDIVMPLAMCADIPVQESEKQREGMEYEVANGETIANEGERHCLLMTKGAKTPKKSVFQVADVHKALMSITRVADAGYACWLDKSGGWLVDKITGEQIPIQRKGNLYVMTAWAREDKRPTFGRQGR